MQEKSVLLEPLFKLLDDLQPVDPALKEALVNSFQTEEIKAGKMILHEGEVCRKLWFLADGLLRSFHEIGDKEATSRIMFTNHIVISAGSFFKQAPATESIEALADSVLLTLSRDDLQKIYHSFPAFNYHTRLITEDYFHRQEQRLYMLRKHDAQAKYEYFLDNYSSYLEHIPQHYIASFLGIAPETLSRIRSKIRKKK